MTVEDRDLLLVGIALAFGAVTLGVFILIFITWLIQGRGSSEKEP